MGSGEKLEIYILFLIVYPLQRPLLILAVTPLYSGVKSGGDKPFLYLALRICVPALWVEPDGETERGVRPLAVIPITGGSCICLELLARGGN